jgi:hypothetical protein
MPSEPQQPIIIRFLFAIKALVKIRVFTAPTRFITD